MRALVLSLFACLIPSVASAQVDAGDLQLAVDVSLYEFAILDQAPPASGENLPTQKAHSLGLGRSFGATSLLVGYVFESQLIGQLGLGLQRRQAEALLIDPYGGVVAVDTLSSTIAFAPGVELPITPQ
jgi:hypothetical protein